MSLFGLFNFTAPYLPWVIIGFGKIPVLGVVTLLICKLTGLVSQVFSWVKVLCMTSWVWQWVIFITSWRMSTLPFLTGGF